MVQNISDGPCVRVVGVRSGVLENQPRSEVEIGFRNGGVMPRSWQLAAKWFLIYHTALIDTFIVTEVGYLEYIHTYIAPRSQDESPRFVRGDH